MESLEMNNEYSNKNTKVCNIEGESDLLSSSESTSRAIIFDNGHRQPWCNIGFLGMTTDGKTTAVKALTGIDTKRSSGEKKDGRTVKIGYSIMDIHNVNGTLCNKHSLCRSQGECTLGNKINTVSFVDCPGHYTMIRTMLGSVKIMDGVIIVIAYDDNSLKLKTSLLEHLNTVKKMDLKKVIVCLNKIDLAEGNKRKISDKFTEIKQLLEEYGIVPSFPIIPVSFSIGYGVDLVMYAINKVFPYNRNEESGSGFFLTNRSFDINKKGTSFKDLQGLVLGGSLTGGSIKVNDLIEIRPGLLYKHQWIDENEKRNTKWFMKRLFTSVESIGYDNSEGKRVEPSMLFSGGLAALRTDFFPMIGDRLVEIPAQEGINDLNKSCMKSFTLGDLNQKVVCKPENVTLDKNNSIDKLGVCDIISIGSIELQRVIEGNDYKKSKFNILVLNQLVSGKIVENKKRSISTNNSCFLSLEEPICISKDDFVIVLDMDSNSIEGESMIFATGVCLGGQSVKEFI